MKTTFVVLNENTLGYTFSDTTKPYFRVFVMAVDYMAGGDPLMIDHETTTRAGEWRVATLADFNFFRVSSDGYRDNPNYIIEGRG